MRSFHTLLANNSKYLTQLRYKLQIDKLYLNNSLEDLKIKNTSPGITDLMDTNTIQRSSLPLIVSQLSLTALEYRLVRDL
jgi:hypothetical protein